MYSDGSAIGTITTGGSLLGGSSVLPGTGVESVLMTALGIALVLGGMLIHRHSRFLAHQAQSAAA
jgi:LPXTG-motif cell wall-anchored protein